MQTNSRKTVATAWKPRTYDVWGNANDGWEVNDSYGHAGIALNLKVKLNNPGTPNQFESAYPSDYQIRQVFGLGKTKIDLEGDDTHIYINRARDGKPLGELVCESHESLSPIRENKETK